MIKLVGIIKLSKVVLIKMENGRLLSSFSLVGLSGKTMARWKKYREKRKKYIYKGQRTVYKSKSKQEKWGIL